MWSNGAWGGGVGWICRGDSGDHGEPVHGEHGSAPYIRLDYRLDCVLTEPAICQMYVYRSVGGVAMRLLDEMMLEQKKDPMVDFDMTRRWGGLSRRGVSKDSAR